MLNFKNDYCGIAHPKVLEKLIANKNNTYIGYGLDEASSRASNLIKDLFGCKTSDVHFLVGGTITNKILIAHTLKSYEAVISATSGHINVHETGAIEETGHKVITIPQYLGKIKPNDIYNTVMMHTDEHMVKPKMVYISNSTEYGTVYRLNELIDIYNMCKSLGLYLYLDGARLGAALTSSKNDIALTDLAKYTDAFYIGGTKNGLLFGEALIINNEKLKEEFRYSIKHFGGMIAKGFICGLEFEALFENNLFFDIAKKQNDLAEYLVKYLEKLNIELYFPQESNQIFIVLDKSLCEKLKEEVLFEVWEHLDEKIVIRLVIHYLHEKEDIDNLILYISS